jgi:hypothetical protein
MNRTSIRVEPVDNTHPAWQQVVSAISRSGNQHALLLHDGGWLSSRQSLLAAFDGDEVVGHLCFRVEPTRSPKGQVELRTKVDSFSIDVEANQKTVEDLLLRTGELRAKLMRCESPRVELAMC